jgi:hypothetical protein
MINKIGDLAFLIGTALLFSYTGSVDFNVTNFIVSQGFNELILHKIDNNVAPHIFSTMPDINQLYLAEINQLKIVN